MKTYEVAKLSNYRTGVIARKVGMSAYFDDKGNRIAVTLLQLETNVVTGVKTVEKDGYAAVQIGTRLNKVSRLNKPQVVELEKLKLPSISVRRQFVVSPDCLLNVGDELSVNHFVAGQLVDVHGVSIGKGFAGVMKRHNFGGLRASHGVSITHRSHGSTGNCQDPGRVFKGKLMAGQMGSKLVTTQNLKVVMVDTERNLILIKGSVPGAENSFITITDAVKSPMKVQVPYPAGLVGMQQDSEVRPETDSSDKVA